MVAILVLVAPLSALVEGYLSKLKPVGERWKPQTDELEDLSHSLPGQESETDTAVLSLELSTSSTVLSLETNTTRPVKAAQLDPNYDFYRQSLYFSPVIYAGLCSILPMSAWTMFSLCIQYADVSLGLYYRDATNIGMWPPHVLGLFGLCILCSLVFDAETRTSQSRSRLLKTASFVIASGILGSTASGEDVTLCGVFPGVVLFYFVISFFQSCSTSTWKGSAGSDK